MPLITTFGNSSARSYGQRARQPQLVQLTYTSNSTFVVPSGVTSLSISGRGGSGSYQPYVAGVAGAAYQTSTNLLVTRTATGATWVSDFGFVGTEPYRSRAFNNNPWGGSAGHEVYSTTAGGSSRIPTWSASTSGPYNAVWNTGDTRTASVYESYTNGIRDSFNTGSYPRSVSAPQPIPFTYIRESSPEVQEAYYTGTDATGFGYTFPGGYGGTATTYSYTKSVSASQSYSLSLPGSSAFITVSYYV